MKINNKYGYVRISSKSQESNSSIESQKQQLIQNGIEEKNIFVEVGSGANEIKNRPVFQELINQTLKENDLLMVTKIDRCSRNTLEFLKLQVWKDTKDIEFVRQTIGHNSLNSTSSYVNQITDEERENRISRI